MTKVKVLKESIRFKNKNYRVGEVIFGLPEEDISILKKAGIIEVLSIENTEVTPDIQNLIAENQKLKELLESQNDLSVINISAKQDTVLNLLKSYTVEDLKEIASENSIELTGTKKEEIITEIISTGEKLCITVLSKEI